MLFEHKDITMQLDSHTISKMDKRHRAHLMNSMSGFRSANLIGTKALSGQENLAVFNSVCHIGANPPYMGFILRPLTVNRNTYDHIMESGFYTINHIHHSFIEKAHHTAAKYPSHISEFEKAGLTPYYESEFHAPYVKESLVRIGLKLEEEVPIKANNTILMVGSVQELHIADGLVADDGWVNLSKAGTVAISNLDTYYKTELIDRLAYAKPDEAVKSLLKT